MICADAFFFFGLVWIFFQIRLIFVNMSGLSFWCNMRFWSCCIHTICSPGSMPTWCGGGIPSRSRSICEIAGFAYSGNWEGCMPLCWDKESQYYSFIYIYVMLDIPSVVFHPVRIQSRLTRCGRLCVFNLFQFPVISGRLSIRKS